MTTIVETGKQTLTADTGYANPIRIHDVGASVTAIPGSGGSIDVQYSTSPDADIVSGSATWDEWDLGNVTVKSTLGLEYRVNAIRAKATTANGVLEVIQ